MKRLFFYINLYFRMIGQYMKMRLQYRADFVIATFGMIFGNAIAVGGLWILFQAIPNLVGWKYEELVFLYGFSLISQAPLQIVFDHIWQLRRHVNQGTFIKYYFKPIHTLFYYVAELIDLKGFGQLAFGICAFAWACMKIGIVWTPLRIVLLPLLILSSSLILVSMMLIASTASFWIKDSFSILAFVNSFRDHSRYPMGIYNALFRFVFTWIIPIGYIAFYPSQFFLSPTPPDWITYLTPVIGILLFRLAVAFWNLGVRTWGGTGS